MVEFVEPNGECHSDRASDVSRRHVWHREPSETQEAFTERVWVDATAKLERLVIFWPAEPQRDEVNVSA
jgi:hypothetical protein